MTYKIIGDFKRKIPIDELGNKNGLEYCKEAVDLFGCIIYPNDTEICFILLKHSIKEAKK